MREIKFRAWDGKNLYEWESDSHPAVEVISGTPNRKLFYLPMSWLVGDSNDWQWMQYTGLKDRNGVEIYEGDILEFTDKWEWYRGNYSVKMMSADQDELKVLKAQYEAEPMSRYKVKYHPYDGYGISKYDLENYLAVVGNIYQNPELLS